MVGSRMPRVLRWGGRSPEDAQGSHHDAEDLISHCIEICLLEKDKIKGVQERGKLRQYFTVMIRYQFLKRLKLKKEHVEVQPEMLSHDPEEIIITTQHKEDRVQATLDSMHFYTSGLLEM